jgi:heme exporter protein A
VTLRRGGRLLFEGLDLELGPGEALHVTGPTAAASRA